MAAISPGRPNGPPRKPKKQTATTNTHRFEPFSKRVARLKIDPVHRVQQNEALQDDIGLRETHFGQSLIRWAELNLSENFTGFVRKVKPVSESLPQILHHADSIFGSLIHHIGKNDAASSEPLLSLLAHFAHDLGQRFEKYFAEAVKLVLSLAATHDASEVIEWSFTCLAWMLKYLSRLLVPDLRPLLGIMAPYLGKTRQRAYVIRFAAESMAFLIRKAGTMYHKNKAPLDNTVLFLFEDLRGMRNGKEKSAFQVGLMSLFSEATRGIDGALHSNSTEIIRCLIHRVKEFGHIDDPCMEVLEGVIISIIHETTAEGFSPLVTLVRDLSLSTTEQSPVCEVSVCIRLLWIIVGTRKATRISDWSGILSAQIHIAKLAGALCMPSPLPLQHVVTAIAMMFQYSPLDLLLPLHAMLMDLVSSGPLSDYFLPFCLLSDEIGRDRFQSLVLPRLQKYLAREWQQNRLGLCLLVRRLSLTGLDASALNTISSPQDRSLIEEGILRALCSEVDEGDLAMQRISKDVLAQFAEDLCLPKDSTVAAKYVEPLRREIINAIKKVGRVDADNIEFWTGRGLKTYIRLAKLADTLDKSLWKIICKEPSLPTNEPILLAALLQYLQTLDMTEIDVSEARILIGRIIDNLLSRTEEVKIFSVRILQHMFRQTGVQTLLETVLQILKMPYGLQTVRQITMLIRRLITLQKDVNSDSLSQKIIPYFFLGLLSSNSAPIVQELHSAIATMCEDLNAEEIVSDILLKSLQIAHDVLPSDELHNSGQSSVASPTRYQCTNLQKVEELAQETFSLFDEPKHKLEKILQATGSSPDNEQFCMTRVQALRAFSAIPHAAEKRSRFVTPVFLSTQPAQDYVSMPLDSAASTSSHTMSPEIKTGKWSFSDQKAFLELLGKFKNPKVLFKSQEVYNALLEFLTVGQSETQKLSLKALFNWKLPNIRRYEESLLKLTDEKTYRDELAHIFHADLESAFIQDEDRSDLLPILLRLLYGQMISRSGAKANHGGQEAKRKTTLRMLFRMQHDEIAQFLNIAFGKISIDVTSASSLENSAALIDVIGIEKQYGVVKTAESMLETLKSQLTPFGDIVLVPVLYCLYRACQRLDKTKYSDTISELENRSALARSIRRTAIHCLCLLFTYCEDIQWSRYLPSIFKNVIELRLENFPIETAQGVSGLLQLFATWAADARRVLYLHNYNKSLLNTVADCLITPSTRDDVKVYILDQIFLKLPQLASANYDLREEILCVLQPHMQHLLMVLRSLLERKENRRVLDSGVALLASLTPLANSSIEVERLIIAIATSLRESPDRVSPKVKGNLLHAVLDLLKLHQLDEKSSALAPLQKVICSLFNYFTDVQNRSTLAGVLEVLSIGDRLASEIASLCSGLNAVSLTKLDDIDYDTRLEAFNAINAKAVEHFTPELWEPVVQNLIYFSRAADDFAIRSNAVSSLRRFISDASELRRPDFDRLLQNVILGALKKAAKADSESVRADHVALIGLLVQKCPDWRDINDMRGLLVGNDEDASFFNNILHIQHHRRTRAMRRLAAEAERGVLSTTNVANFFLPVLEKFIFDKKDDESVRNLRGQAIPTVGVLLQWVEWSQFRAIFKRYKSYLSSNSEAEKDIIKLLGVAADALVRCSDLRTANEDTVMEDAPDTGAQTALARSLASMESLSRELTTSFIPDLAAFIHQKDESQITSRIPVAVATVKLLKVVHETQMVQFLPPLLLDIAYILRSRSQDSRDIARRTLAEVTSILGPSCIQWILKELRTALARGYQLHVLSYTIHAILVSNTDQIKPGDLDYCLDGLVAVVMDDIFGIVGQEKDAEEYISKMREVKSSKSFDSMELLAKSTTVRHLIQLIRPLQALLTGTITSKQSRQVDELLRRIGLGLSRNEAAGSRDILVFSFQIIQELYQERRPAAEKLLTTEDLNRERYLVQLSGANKTIGSTTSPSIYKLAKFALDVVRSTLQKHNYLLEPEYVHGFLPILGDALVQGQEEVKISAIRLLSTIIKLPMSELEDNASLYVGEAVKVVKSSLSTNAEAAQAALKLIAAILRERRTFRVRDSEISYLLHRIIPDLEEPDRQGVTFNFLKAVMGRKMMLPELYDANKKIGTMMVTNHDQGARDAARGVFVYFLLEYPQSKERWNKQLKFLVKNLAYQHPEGRQSIMEAVHMVLNKTGEAVCQELIAKIFIPLVLIMVNDDNVQCRQMAGVLLGRCFEKAEKERLRSILDSIRGWIEQSDNLVLNKAGMQAFMILFEVPNPLAEKEVPASLSAIYRLFKETTNGESEEDWENLHHALQLFSKLAQIFPALVMPPLQNHMWSRIRALLTYPHPWVQSNAAGLIGTWFHDLATANGKSSLGGLPLVGSHGLELTADAQLDVLRSSLRILKRNRSSKDLSTQSVRNLVFLGRCFNANNLSIDTAESIENSNREDQEGSDEENESDTSDDDTPTQSQKIPAISYLLTQLSAIIRREPRKPTSAALLPKQSSLQLLAALIHHTPPNTLAPLLPQTILPPLAHLTDPSNPPPHSSSDTSFTTTHQDLTTSAAEVLDMLQKKLGSADYVRAMTEAQGYIREKREQRRIKRKVERVADPEGAAREKRRRVEKEKRRKERKREGFRRGRKGL